MTLPFADDNNSSCCTGGKRRGHRQDSACPTTVVTMLGTSSTATAVTIRTALLPEFRHRRMKQQSFEDFSSTIFFVINLISIFLSGYDDDSSTGEVFIVCCSLKNSSQACHSGLPVHSDAVPGLLGASAQEGGSGGLVGIGWLRGGASTPRLPDAADCEVTSSSSLGPPLPPPQSPPEAIGGSRDVVPGLHGRTRGGPVSAPLGTTEGRSASAAGPEVAGGSGAPSALCGRSQGAEGRPRDAGGPPGPLPDISPSSQNSECLFDADPGTTPGRCRCSGCRLAAENHLSVHSASHSCGSVEHGGLPQHRGGQSDLGSRPSSRRLPLARGAVGQGVLVVGTSISGFIAAAVAGVITDIQGLHHAYRVHMPHGHHKWFTKSIKAMTMRR